MEVIIEILVQLAQTVLVVALAPGLTGVVRRIKARLLRREGPPAHQVYKNLARMLRKKMVIAENASRLFFLAPYLVFGVMWTAAALVPTFSTRLLFSPASDLIALVALMCTARFVLALGALDVGTGFGGLGASREMMIASLVEPTILMIVFTVSLLVHTTHLPTVAESGPVSVLMLVPAVLAMIIVTLAENTRIPVDNPATHLELTMVHEAMVLEYSGRHLALMELASSLKLVLYLSLFSCLFFRYGIAPASGSFLDMLVGLIAWVFKLTVGAILLALCEISIAKMRLFRLGDLLRFSFLLGALSMCLVVLFGSSGP